MKYISKNLGSYKLHMINADNFKQTIVRIVFRGPIKKSDITIRNFLASMLTYSSSLYDTRRKMLLRAEELYSAGIYTDSKRLGNEYETSFELISLDDKYTESGNFEESLKFFTDMILKPNVKDNKFDSKSFNIIMNKAALYLSSRREDKDSYSMDRLYEIMGGKSPIGFLDGYIEDLKNITPESLYKYYNEFISKSDISIYVIGSFDPLVMDPLIRKYFKPNKYKKRMSDFIIEHKKRRIRKLKVTEHDEMAQSKLCIGLKMFNINTLEKEYPMILYSIILGGSSDSKLFKEVRERNSLCYYIYSSPNSFDNTMIINAGISSKDYDKCIKLINKNLKDMEKGNFTDDDINKAKEIYISSLTNLYESEEGLIDFYSNMDLLGTDDIETRIRKIKTVKKNDIMSVARKISIDTIYMLEGDL